VNRATSLILLVCAVSAGLGSAAAAPIGPPAAAQPAARPQGLRRFALVVGANNGGTDRVTLRFAGSDARAFSRVLSELGGAAADDVEVLVDPSLAAVRAGFDRIEARMAAARSGGRRVEFIVYYSGHSDEEGLLLSGLKLSYDDLRQQIRDMPADVQIAILDSCASGAFTRSKGGKRMPAFLVDESHQVQGHAFLSSSSADEQAQESDRLGGSFFTHAFVGGLRGAADTNRDGRVTLSEAYQFAYSETIARTQNTRYGAQHPGYEMHLVGTGDVILTDLRGTTAAVVLDKEVAGRIFVRARDQHLFLELTKQADAPRLLGLPPDTYEIVLDTGGRRASARVIIRQGQRITLGVGDFRQLSPEETVARGGPPGLAEEALRSSALHIDLFRIPSDSDDGRHFVALNLLVGGGAALDGLEIGGLVNVRTRRARGTQIAGIANITDGPAGLQLAGITNWTRGRADIGQIAGIINSSQGADGFQLAGIANVATGPSPGLQIAGITNLQRDGDAGLQIAGILNWTSGAPRLGQIGGIGSWANAGIDGFQVSGILSVSGRSLRGLQIAGITNQVRGDSRGVQVAAINNTTTGNVSGMQISLVNYGADVGGAQIGLVNVARRIHGLQLGLVNVATESSAGGAPIGLLSLSPDGHRAVEAWVADVIPGRLGVKIGSRNLYTLLAVAASNEHLAAGAGLGIHLPARRFYLDFDLSFYEVREEDFGEAEGIDAMAEARAMIGIPLDLGLSVFAGISSTGVMSWDPAHRARDISVFTLTKVGGDDGDDFSMRIAPGFFAGLSY
jgi:hypothetical protein